MSDVAGASIAPIGALSPNALSTVVADPVMQTPTAQQANDFAHAIATSAQDQLSAPLPADATRLSASINDNVNAFVRHVQSVGQMPQIGEHAANSAPSGLSEVRQTVDESMSTMRSAYAFAIETTMASRGSTETTKIFNTLLKGQ